MFRFVPTRPNLPHFTTLSSLEPSMFLLRYMVPVCRAQLRKLGHSRGAICSREIVGRCEYCVLFL